MILDKIGYGYNDLTIVPSKISTITSRSQCNPYTLNEEGDLVLPIFTAPMDSVVNLNNVELWEQEKIIPIIPRTIDFIDRIKQMGFGRWVAIGLNELDIILEDLNNFYDSNFIEKYCMLQNETPYFKICIDVANGHMEHMLSKVAKLINLCNDNNVKVYTMVGNIANPYIIRDLCELGIDYVRCGIGGGSGCTTTSNTGIHYPMASLINDTFEYRENIFKNCLNIKKYNKTKIIADGGIRGYADINKALALGADYVMIGGLFASFFESAADIQNVDLTNENKYIFSINVRDTKTNVTKLINITKELSIIYPEISYSYNDYIFSFICDKDLLENEDIKRYLLNFKLKKQFYGMSTKMAQKKMGKKTLCTSEGKISIIEVKYTMHQWTDNMLHYLRSAMSYCNAYSLYNFIGNVMLKPNQISEINAVNK